MKNADLREAGQDVKPMTDDKGQGQPIRNARTATWSANKEHWRKPERRPRSGLTSTSRRCPEPKISRKAESARIECAISPCGISLARGRPVTPNEWREFIQTTRQHATSPLGR